jgi:hypothetical protein
LLAYGIVQYVFNEEICSLNDESDPRANEEILEIRNLEKKLLDKFLEDEQ